MHQCALEHVVVSIDVLCNVVHQQEAGDAGERQCCHILQPWRKCHAMPA